MNSDKLRWHPNPVVNMVLDEVAAGRGLASAAIKLGLQGLIEADKQIMIRIALASVAPGSTQLSDYDATPDGVTTSPTTD